MISFGDSDVEQLPRLTLKIVKMDNGYLVECIDPAPIVKAVKDAMNPSGPKLRTDEDIDRTIDAMIEFNKHMHSQIVDREDWKDDDGKRALVREGFKLSFPQLFQRPDPTQVSALIFARSLVFAKVDDLVKFIKSAL
jgi:hypothetical protein